MPHASFRNESRKNYGITYAAGTPEPTCNNEQLRTGALMRIADALESIDKKLACPTVANALRAIIRSDKRLAHRRPLGGRKKA